MMFYQELIVEFTASNVMLAYNPFNRMEDNIEVAYWSYTHKAWILHKRFLKSVIHYNGHPIPFKSKSEAAKSNQMFNPSFYSIKMNKNELQKVKAFYAKQNDCPSLKWTMDANKVQRAVCTREGNAGGACKYNLCPKVNSNKQL